MRSRRASKKKRRSAATGDRPELYARPGQPEKCFRVQELAARAQHLEGVQVEGIDLEGLVELGMRVRRRQVLGKEERHALIAVPWHEVHGAQHGPTFRLEACLLGQLPSRRRRDLL